MIRSATLCLAVTLVQQTLMSSGDIIRSSQENKARPSRYYFVAACTRSIMKVIASRRYDNIQQCQHYAIKRKGFAINFVNKELLHSGSRNFSGDTCLVYDCPEFDVETTLDTSTVYDYYSAYARPMPNTNVSCVPKLGVFQLHKTVANYSDAETICNEEGGTMADITSRFHTETLASLMSSEMIREAFIGLNRLEYPEQFLNSRGLPLNCLNYRAWAPGEPKPKHDANCVVLTTKQQWKIESCDRQLPFVCELAPNGPYRPCLRNHSRRRRQRCRERFSRSLPTPDRYPKCGDPNLLKILERRNQVSGKRSRGRSS